DGKFSLDLGLSRVRGNTLNMSNLAADAAIFTIAEGSVGKINSFTSNALERSPFLKNLAIGTTFGATSGAMGEISRATSNGESIDWSKVFKSAALNGAIDGVAAIPGGIQADAGLRAAAASQMNRVADHARFHTARGMDSL